MPRFDHPRHLKSEATPHLGILLAEGNSRMYGTIDFFLVGGEVGGVPSNILYTIHTHDYVVIIIVVVFVFVFFLPFLQSTSVMCVAGQGVVPGGYVIAEGPGGVPMAFPVQQTGGGVTVPYGHAEIVPMPPQGVTQVIDQPPPYDQISTTGGLSPTAEEDPPPPYSKDEQVSVKCCVNLFLFNAKTKLFTVPYFSKDCRDRALCVTGCHLA